MVKEKMEVKFEVTKCGGLHIDPKVGERYRKLQDLFDRKKIRYHTCGSGKNDFGVLI